MITLSGQDILEEHCKISQQGFKALEKILIFCCSGCGLCVSVCPQKSIVMNQSTKRPELCGECGRCGFCYLSCPRSFLPLSKIEEAYYGIGKEEEEKRLGRFLDLFASRSLTEEIYREGTPGGTTTSIVHFLLEKGYVNAALLTKGMHDDVKYCMHPLPYIAASPVEALQSSHSKFEISPVLSRLRDLSQRERVLFVGTPCHIIAFRKLQTICHDDVLKRNMKGLVHVAEELTSGVKFALSINCFLNHTSMDKVYEWLGIQEKAIRKFNENVSKNLYSKALADGKDWRWFFKNNVVTNDDEEIAYDLNYMGKLVLFSGCLACNDLMVSKYADASIGFFGAEAHEKDIGWNIAVIRNRELKEVVDKMVAEGKLERKLIVRDYGKTLRLLLEKVIPTIDVMGVKEYLLTEAWPYPKTLRFVQGTKKTYLLGLELIFLAQTLRKKLFVDGPLRALRHSDVHLTTIY